MENKPIFGIVILIIGIVLFLNIYKGSTQAAICVQVLTTACNPSTNQIQTFPTPCDVPEGWIKDLSQCSENTQVKRQIIVLAEKIEVTLRIEGHSKFGGIIKENIPSGLEVQGITNLNLGASGSATGKLTGNIYEIAFVVDNVANPTITYVLSKPQQGIPYDLSGNFEFAQGFLSGCVPSDDFVGQQSEIETLCSKFTTKETCGLCDQNQCEFCKWNDIQGFIGGQRQIFNCVKKCIRPSNLCASSNSVPDTCGDFCTGIWNVKKRTDADLNCNNFLENTELLGSINEWVLNKQPFNDNRILLQVISAWVRSTGCIIDSDGIFKCPSDGG